jgi:hypothetical protein
VQYPPRAYLIVNNSTPPSSATPFTSVGLGTWSPVRPAYLPQLVNAVVPDANKHNATIGFVKISPFTFTSTWDHTVQVFDPSFPNAVLQYGSIHEVSITRNHPWHLHIYNMMVRHKFLTH